MPITCVTDSKTLHESIYSTKQVQEVGIRVLIAWIKEQLNQGIVNDVIWTDTKYMVADFLIKKTVSPDNFQKFLNQYENGNNDKISEKMIQIHLVDEVMKEEKIEIQVTMSFPELKEIYLNQRQGQSLKYVSF